MTLLYHNKIIVSSIIVFKDYNSYNY